MLEGAAPYNTLDEVGFMSKVIVYVNPRQYDRIIRRRIERGKFLERRGRPKPVYVPIGIRELPRKHFQTGTFPNVLDAQKKFEDHLQNGLLPAFNNANTYHNNPLSSNQFKSNFNNAVCHMAPVSNGCLVNGVPTGNVASGTLHNGALPDTEPVKLNEERGTRAKRSGGSTSRNATRYGSNGNNSYKYDATTSKRGRGELTKADKAAKRSKVGEPKQAAGINTSSFVPAPGTQYPNGQHPDFGMGTFKGHYGLHNGQPLNGYGNFLVNTGFGPVAQATSNPYNFSAQGSLSSMYIKNPIPNLNSLSYTTSTSSGSASTDRGSARFSSKSKEEIKKNYLSLNAAQFSKSSIDSEVVAKTEHIYNINHQGIVVDISPNKTLKVGVGAGIAKGVAGAFDGRMYGTDRGTTGNCASLTGTKTADWGDYVFEYTKGELGHDADYGPSGVESGGYDLDDSSNIYRELCSCFSEG